MDALDLTIAIACLIAAGFVALCIADLLRSARIRRIARRIAPPHMYVSPPVRLADMEDDDSDRRGCA